MTMPTVSIVVAVAENGVIGAKGALPWRLSSDLKRFRALTMGKPVIMGRHTFDSIGKALDGRENIVLTRFSKYAYKGVWVVEDIEEALDFGRRLAEELGADEIMIIGGEQVYRASLPFTDRVYMTEVAARPDGDAFFPELDPGEWQEISREPCPAGERDDHPHSYILLERR